MMKNALEVASTDVLWAKDVSSRGKATKIRFETEGRLPDSAARSRTYSGHLLELCVEVSRTASSTSADTDTMYYMQKVES